MQLNRWTDLLEIEVEKERETDFWNKFGRYYFYSKSCILFATKPATEINKGRLLEKKVSFQRFNTFDI